MKDLEIRLNEAYADVSKFKCLLENRERGIHRWCVMAIKEKLVKQGDEDWYDEDELFSSIMSYAEGNDLKYPLMDVKLKVKPEGRECL